MTITKEQAQTRFKTLTPLLKSALFSVQTAESIARVAEQNTLPKEKSTQMAEVAGLVILGFLRPEDAAPEIQLRLGVPAQSAKSISDSLSSKIFSPLKIEIDRAYQPLAGGDKKPTFSTGSTSKPSIVEEIKQLEKSGEELVGVLKRMESPVKPAQPPSFPASSGMVKTPAAPFIPPRPSAVPLPPSIELKTTPPPPVHGPVILHRESEANPLASGLGFKLDIPSGKFSDRGVTPESTGKMARLEVGGMQKSPANATARTGVAGAGKTLNYGGSFDQNPRPTVPPPLPIRPTEEPFSKSAFGGLPPVMPKPSVLPQSPQVNLPNPPRPQPPRPEQAPPNLPPLPDKKYQTMPRIENKPSPFGWIKSLFGNKQRPVPPEVKVVNLSADSRPTTPKIELPQPQKQGPPPIPASPRPPTPPLPPPPTPGPRSSSPTVDIKLKAPAPTPNQTEEVIDLSSLTKIRK
ncbi:MAG: solute carrier family 39 (zinc transporter), member 1/2/3 [Parcubacteria group bacterium Gr01-1014_20]|nr:MAG: solute carrier family 39 (zinc transporter), member 1/2/3 [Parcubacteria group bacterium Gr01-1014_20]